MLVMHRRLGERFVIGHSIEVEIQAVRGDMVQLVFYAPPNAPIYREELCRRMAGEARHAEATDPVVESRYFAECP